MEVAMRPAYLHGSAVSIGWRDASASLTDLIYACVSAALRDAGIRAADLDAVVLAAHDIVDGRGLTSMVTAPAAAAYLKDETRLGDDGALAFLLGDARIRSGSADTSEGQPDEIAHALFDPFTARPLALTEIAVSGLRATQALAELPGYREHRAAAATRRGAAAGRADGTADPARRPAAAWPLGAGDLPEWADVVAAVVLRSERSAVRVAGVGASTEPFELGDRNLMGMPALREASSRALTMAAVPAADITVLELDGLTLFDEALAAEAVGAAPPGGGMELLASGTQVNPDGGSAAGYGAPAMGLVRICRARERLLAGGGLALATGSSVVAGQGQAAIVLEGASA
jgi:hypothetical protein